MSKNNDQHISHAILKYGSIEKMYEKWLTEKASLTEEEKDVIFNWLCETTQADIELKDDGYYRHVEISIPLDDTPNK
jgi:hypothetical protein